MRKADRQFIVGTLTAVMVLGTVVLGQKQTTVFVTVVAPSSGPLAGLKAADFNAQGGKVEVKDAVRATEPLAIEVLVDVSRPQMGVAPPTQELRPALQAFVQTIHSGEPQARIGLYQVAGAAVAAVNLGAPAAALNKAIDTLAPGPDMGGAVIVEGVQDASHTLANEPAPRRVIVTIDFASADSFPDSRVDSVVKDVMKTGVSVWAISARMPIESTATNGSQTMQYSNRENALNGIIKSNGGQRIQIVAASGLKDQLQVVANSLLSQYELTIAGIDAQHIHDVKLTTTGGAKVITSVFAR